MRKLPGQRPPNPQDKRAAVTGELAHESAVGHATGAALYLDDIPLPADAVHAYVGLSEISCGKILALDLDEVRNAPGVIDVLTTDDISGDGDIGPVFPGDPLLASQDVQFDGQILFAVAATSARAARQAARMARVRYAKNPAIGSIEEGLAQSRFVRPSHTQSRGNAGEAIAGAPHQLSGELRIGGQEHFYLEGQAAICVPQENDGMLVYSSTQHPAEGQKLVAEVLGVAMHRVTVEVRRMGGAFGGKETNANQWACIAALLARKTGRSVKLRLARTDDMRCTGKRHHFLSQYRVGFDDEGRILGLDLTLSGGCGMSPDLSDAIVDRAMFHCDNAYFIPAVTVTGHRVMTNTVSNTAFRGFGGPQGMLAIEHVIDELASKLGRDPLAVRQLNVYSAEGGRDTTHYGQTLNQHIIHPLMERLAQGAQYHQRRAEIRQYNADSPILKKGLALTPVKFGISFTVSHLNQAGALIHIFTDGSIALNHGGTEMGQGLYTKVAQVVATVFQVDVQHIACTATRTDKVPNTSPTAASSGSDLNGMAAHDAATRIRDRLVEFAGQHFGVEASAIVFQDNTVLIGETRLTFPEFIQLAYLHRISLSATGFYATPDIYYDRDKACGHPFFYFAYGAAVSEVIIDTLTGEYQVSRVDICHDVGRSINPAIDIGQVEGGFIQGMGWLTTEELVWDDQGKLLTASPANYKIPSIGDTPAQFNVELLPDSPNVQATIFHSKAVGEPPLMLAISVWCALRDAISSVTGYTRSPLLDAPATPERVLSACQGLLDSEAP